IALSNTIVETALTDIHVTMSLRLALNRSAMPVNDYIIRAAPEEKVDYITLRDEVDRQFKSFTSVLESRPELRETLDKTLIAWKRAKELASSIMQIPNPIGDPAAAEKMEAFDAQIDHGTNLLSGLYDDIYQDTLKSHDKLHEIESRSTILVTLLSFIGLIVGIVGSFQLARLFFPPLENIVDGVRLFGSGRLDHRIGHDMPVELEELKYGINDMAGRLDDIYSELKKSSHRDSLTGCHNRRKMDEDVIAAFSQAQRGNENLSILMLDLDRFKEINDTYGHAAGDAVLLSAAEIMRSQLRKYERLYRYGGEEFVIVLPSTNAKEASVLAERIRMSLGSKKMDVGSNSPISVTVSIGIADNSNKEHGINDLFDLADKALYAAKEGGRDRVHISS
ncbi:MAG: diguanylate cyclase, partial [Mariprofundaceae bacterium]